MAAFRSGHWTAKQSEREIAHYDVFAQQCFSGWRALSTLRHAAGLSSLCHAAFSLYRYLSPVRPAYSPSRPITEIRLRKAQSKSDIGYHGEIAIHRGAGCTNCGAVDITMIGLRLCKRHQSSLRQWQYLVWQVALTMTWSAAWLAQVPALWLQKCWVLTAQAQCLRALPSACFAMTQVWTPAAKLNNRAHDGRAINGNRRRGHAPAAVFAFLGT